MSEARERRRVKVREAILDGARELFARHGYDAVTMRQIAEKIDYSPTVLYSHFKHKEALIRELCSIDFLEFSKNLSRLSSIADPLERLRRCGEAYVEFGVSHPNHYRLMFMTPLADPLTEEMEQRQGNIDLDAYAFLESAVAECVAAGVFLREFRDAQLIAQTMWSSLHGVVSLHITHSDTKWFKLRDVNERAGLMFQWVLPALTGKKEA